MVSPLDALEPIFDAIDKRFTVIETDEHLSVEFGAILRVAFADLPTPFVGTVTQRLRFVTDGRKLGQGPGGGTGVLAYDDGVEWRRTADDTVVAV